MSTQVHVNLPFCSLDAAHDGDSNSCSPNDQFVMAPIKSSTDETTRGNHWRFSNCSVEKFDAFLTALNKYTIFI